MSKSMTTVNTGTLIGYEVGSGTKLFTEANRPITMNDGTSSLPRPNDIYITGRKRYRVISIRRTSTQALYEMDVQVEAEAD